MADATKTPETTKALHSEDPILSKKSHVFGMVEIFPPNADPEKWPNRSFLVMSKHGNTGAGSMGLCEYIKAKYVHEVFERPYFISEYMKYGTPDLIEREAKVEPETTDAKPYVRKDSPGDDSISLGH